MNVVITGASKGLGKAMAEIFASNGHNLFICARSAAALYKTVDELVTQYPGIFVKANPCDLSIKEEAKNFGKWILDFDTDVDVVINNAGSFVPGSVYNEEDGAIEAMIEGNLYSAYHLTRTLLPRMMQQKSGYIFNICSIAALKAYANGGAYSISKFAMAGFSKNLREEMKPHGIKVTAVYPGATYTDSWAASGLEPKRFMEANDIAKLVYDATQLSTRACVEEIVVRPQLGDI